MLSSELLNPTLPDIGRPTVKWSNLPGLASSLAISITAKSWNGPVLVITSSNEQADQLRRELNYFCPDNNSLPVLSFPDWETLPYDNFSAHQDIISDRLNTLYRLPHLDQGILIVAFNSLMQRLPPKQYIVTNSLMLKIGTKFDLETRRRDLLRTGYQYVDSVYEHGEFAIRGSIMDIYPMGSKLPYRIDLIDDEIETLRTFDPESQRSISQVDAIRLLPGKEYPLNEVGISEFRTRFRERFDVDTRSCPLYQDVSQGISSPGLEYYLAMFFQQLDCLFDFLPANSLLIRTGDIETAGQEFWHEIKIRFNDRLADRYRPILNPAEVFLSVEEVFSEIRKFPLVEIDPTGSTKETVKYAFSPLPDLTVNSKQQAPLASLEAFLQVESSSNVLICAESAGRREALLDLFETINLAPVIVDDWDQFLLTRPRVALTVAPLDQGLWLKSANIILLCEAQLFGGKIAQRRRRGKQQDNSEFVIKSLSELGIGDAIVHFEHGVGRYQGLQTLVVDEQATEFLVLTYAKQTKLYVPVSSLHLVSRYSGADPDLAPLNHLGSDAWQKAKRQAAEKIHDVAAELLEIYARRESKKGVSYNCDDIDFEQFIDSFPFEETDDQLSTIAAVTADMASERSMDRLVCGDVGFGKTEVAMRAAFIAVQNNRQVAILVPTTLLAQQHFTSFSDRFADWPVTVEVISRFKSPKQQLQVLKGVASGNTDILIGTHKLLNNDIKYKNLGLLVIDEEHRFGVRQKEKLKSLRANVDILTLTATPIPRTLNMALSGVRDLSLIVTPPAKRLSVKTFVREEQDSLIKEAVLRELLRGGQIFYLHNEVKSIQRTADHLQEIVPQARIVVAHGQMPERELEKVMADFYHKRYNLLVCTTIIESGIDIPSANTIIIHRADKFGLAQLHQLRGRVGRSHHQAYAYLLTDHHGKMSSDAHKRIDAIKAASSLGAGFTLASHDLEIRGAGEFLGDEQSGHMQKIGFSLYLEMLDEAVKAMKSGKTPTLDLALENAIEINLRIPALIPEVYLPDVHTRLVMYKRISAGKSVETLRELQVEMIDRFGLLPKQLKLLFRLTEMKLKALEFGIRKIDANISSGRVEFGAKTRVDPLSIVEMVQDSPQHYKLSSANQLMFYHLAENDAGKKLDFITSMLDRFRIADQPAV